MKRATERARKRKVGNPFDATSQQGAQVSKEQFDKVMGYIKSAKEEGATLQLGGNRVGDKVIHTHHHSCSYTCASYLWLHTMISMFIGLLHRTNRIQ